MAHAATAWSREPAATRRKDEMTRAMRCAAERPSHTMATHPSSILLNQAAPAQEAHDMRNITGAHMPRAAPAGQSAARCATSSEDTSLGDASARASARAPLAARARPAQTVATRMACEIHRGSANFARPETPKSDPRTTSEVGLTSEVIRGLPGLKCVVVEDIKSNLPEKSRSGSPRGNATWQSRPPADAT